MQISSGEDRNSDLCETGIEWGHGLYLGNTPSTINFALLRREHGVEKEIDTIDAFGHLLPKSLKPIIVLQRMKRFQIQSEKRQPMPCMRILELVKETLSLANAMTEIMTRDSLA